MNHLPAGRHAILTINRRTRVMWKGRKFIYRWTFEGICNEL